MYTWPVGVGGEQLLPLRLDRLLRCLGHQRVLVPSGPVRRPGAGVEDAGVVATAIPLLRSLLISVVTSLQRARGDGRPLLDCLRRSIGQLLAWLPVT